MNKKTIKKLLAVLVPLAVIAGLGLLLLPYFDTLSTQEGRDTFAQAIRSHGAFGIVILIFVQVAQVILFIIPGEFVELVAGVIYGTFGGFVICCAGIALGSAVIFSTVHYIGEKRIKRLFGQEHFAIFDNKNRVELVLFVLFFIPGTPKDGLTYFAPFTGISLGRFLLITLVARIPSVISSTYVGATLQEGNFLSAIIIYAIIGILGIIGILVDRKLREKAKNTKDKI